MSRFWNNKKVLVTGGAGFIGSHIVDNLIYKGANVTIIDTLENGSINNLKKNMKNIKLITSDCRDKSDAYKACRNQEIVLNLAARVGGIEYNKTHQATMLRDNLDISLSMIEAARLAGVERFLAISSACVYPHVCKIPTPESEGFKDEPEPTNGGYGWAKRMTEKLAEYYSEEFRMKIGIVRPYNCYGPRDHFDLNSAHVIPALIKRVMDNEDPLKVWGSGKQTRSFIYVEDLVEGILLSVEKYPKSDPINLGTDEEITIEELANKIVHLTDKKTKIRFDKSKPDGNPRRNCDTRKAKKILGFEAKTKLDIGLRETIKWYKQH